MAGYTDTRWGQNGTFSIHHIGYHQNISIVREDQDYMYVAVFYAVVEYSLQISSVSLYTNCYYNIFNSQYVDTIII